MLKEQLDRESDSDNSFLDQSLLTREHDAAMFLDDFIYETKRVNKFFIQDLKSIELELKVLKDKFEVKRKSEHQKRANTSAMAYQDQMVLGQEKDEFEFAISWKRAFSQIYIKLTWLNSFAHTNSITCQTQVIISLLTVVLDLLKSFRKRFFMKVNRAKYTSS